MVKVGKVNPPSLGKPLGYSHGVKANGFLFVGGQIGAEPRDDGRHRVVSREFAPQFERALRNFLEVVKAAGGTAESVVEMVVYVKSMGLYRESRPALGEAWKRVMGKHYPAMTLVEVTDLFEDDTMVEIRGVAAVD